MSENPYCIFCGGTVVATTTDHVPPRAMFTGKHRPKGLEFSACDDCNGGGRLDEQITSLISYMYPNVNAASTQREDIKRLLNGVANNAPGLLQEMLPSSEQVLNARSTKGIPPDARVLNISPRVQNALNRFAGKIAFALHYEATKRIVPVGGVARAWFKTNFQHLAGGIPQEFLDMLGPRQSLTQGSWTVDDQFGYASAIPEDSNAVSVHFATFRFSFAVIAFVSEDAARHADLLTGKSENTLFAPGWLKRTQVT